jgi:beta-barrel assembly-enhancing protease
MRSNFLPKQCLSASFVALAALCATAPFNMGGCADTTAAIGGYVGGSQGESYGRALGHGVQAQSLGERDELAMGQSVAMQVTARYRIDSDLKLNQYVVLVGLTLVNTSPKPDGNWYFAVVDDEQPNAFSGPEGYIFITRAALKQMRDESELAGVLAHEMTHVLEHHGLKAARNSGTYKAAVEAGSTAVQANQALNQFSASMSGLGDVVFVKGYDRGQEDQADAGAVKLVTAAGYDPNGYLNFLTRISAEQRQGGTNAAFSTHPDAASRVAKVRQQIASMNVHGGATLRDRFEKNVGIAAGPGTGAGPR